MQEITTQNDFDYSLVDFETQEFLQERSNIIYGIQSKSAYEIGKQLVKAQEVLAKNRYGCFEEWYSSLGFRKTKAYEYINHYNFIRSQSEQLNIETFEELPKKLQSEMSKPSANPELNQKVFDGDITTHKQYKELERQLKLAEADKERLKQQNERLAEKALSAKVVEKEVIKEVIPDDYESTKQLNQTLLGKNKELSKMVDDALQHEEYLKSQLKEFYAKRDEVNHKSAKYDELTEAIKQSEGKLNSYQKKIASYKNITELLKKGDLLLLEMSGLIYADETHYIQRDGLIKQEFDSLVDRGLKLFNDLDMKRKNTEILEGEVL
ncbi:hypothetical protein [Streptococcus agalactiae]|uniref:hypothetical protein n=1 Tax=Streptococcus agalactiae TaxID=1311 RepID=UPI00061C27EB|nr:hypothetical protein [Streptococcus agalactiae]CNF67345.1 Uncharacterised protein [Streptococcus agalactiae]